MSRATSLIILFLFSISGSAQNAEQYQIAGANLFMSELNLKGDTAIHFEYGSYESLLMDLIKPTVEKARSGEIQVYDAHEISERDTGYLTTGQVSEKLTTTRFISYDPFVVDTIPMNKYTSIRPYESWNWESGFHLQKKVHGYSIVSDYEDLNTGLVKGKYPTIYIPCTESSEFRKVARIRYSQPITQFLSDEEWYRQNLEHSVREELFTQLLLSVETMQQPAFFSPQDPDLADSLWIEQSLYQMDTITPCLSGPPYDIVTEILKERCSWTDIQRIEFIQEIFANETGSIKVKVDWYAPVVSDLDELTGEIVQYRPLFWIKN